MALAWAVLVCLTAVGFVAGRDGKDGAANDETAQTFDAAMNAMN